MSGKGSAALKKFREGKRLSRPQACLAKCAECLNDYLDAETRQDCGVMTCPLHPFMPYTSSPQKSHSRPHRPARNATVPPAEGSGATQ